MCVITVGAVVSHGMGEWEPPQGRPGQHPFPKAPQPCSLLCGCATALLFSAFVLLGFLKLFLLSSCLHHDSRFLPPWFATVHYCDPVSPCRPAPRSPACCPTPGVRQAQACVGVSAVLPLFWAGAPFRRHTPASPQSLCQLPALQGSWLQRNARLLSLAAT